MIRLAAHPSGWCQVATILVSLLMLAACQSTPESPQEAIRTATPQDRAALHIDLIDRLMTQKQYFAAMAHIDAAQANATGRGQAEQLSLLRAECLRKTKQLSAAESEYRRLLPSRTAAVAASAAHGLGLTLAATQPDESLRFLRQAVDKQPTAPDMRNDLGYALMLNGQFAAAHRELSTAYQLAPANAKPRNNLIVLLLAAGRISEAQRIENSAELDAETRRSLREQAARIAEQRAIGRARGA